MFEDGGGFRIQRSDQVPGMHLPHRITAALRDDRQFAGNVPQFFRRKFGLYEIADDDVFTDDHRGLRGLFPDGRIDLQRHVERVTVFAVGENGLGLRMFGFHPADLCRTVPVQISDEQLFRTAEHLHRVPVVWVVRLEFQPDTMIDAGAEFPIVLLDIFASLQ